MPSPTTLHRWITLGVTCAYFYLLCRMAKHALSALFVQTLHLNIMPLASFSSTCKTTPLLTSLSVSSLLVFAGFAFVYFEHERDAEDAIRSLDNTPFGYSKRRLSVEWARGERGSRHNEGSKSMANQKPTKTLFVINFDPLNTRTRDIERHFEPYGKVIHVRIRRNFAFVQFDKQEEATKALEGTHMTKVLGRVVSVEYALRDDGERGDRHDSPKRGYAGRGDSPYGRSRSPVHRRSRPSPDYGRARSPVYDKYNGPSYNRERSAEFGRYRSRSPVRR